VKQGDLNKQTEIEIFYIFIFDYTVKGRTPF